MSNLISIPPYNPADHYWIVAGETCVFSSGLGNFVAPDDGDYLHWLAAGGVATRIASTSELAEVLARQAPHVPRSALVPPSAEDVAAERARRLAAGFDYDFSDGRGAHRIGTTPDDLAGWDEVSKLAAALIATGSGSTTINIVTDTGAAAVTAVEWQEVLLAAAAFRQPIWAASFALQASDPIPDDFADDTHWQ